MGDTDPLPGSGDGGGRVAHTNAVAVERVVVPLNGPAGGVDHEIEVEIDELDDTAREGGWQRRVALELDDVPEVIEGDEDAQRKLEAEVTEGMRNGRAVGRDMWGLLVIDDEPAIRASLHEIAEPGGLEGTVVLALARLDGIAHVT